MKKLAILSVFTTLIIAAAFLAQCGDDDKSPCEEFAEKYENCMKEACKDYSSCATCSQQSIDAIVKGFKDAKCEGQLKTETEDKLKNFNCDNMKASVKSACSASGK